MQARPAAQSSPVCIWPDPVCVQVAPAALLPLPPHPRAKLVGVWSTVHFVLAVQPLLENGSHEPEPPAPPAPLAPAAPLAPPAPEVPRLPPRPPPPVPAPP